REWRQLICACGGASIRGNGSFAVNGSRPMKNAITHDVLGLKIADIDVALDIADPNKRAAVRERYREFIVSDVVPELTIRVEVRDGARFVPLRSGPWIVELKDEGSRLNYRSHYDAGWIDIERGRGFVELAPEADIENYLRVVYARL